MGQVAAAKTTTKAWKLIGNMYASQTCARAINLRLALATVQKGTSTSSEFFGKMQALGDEMVVAGKPLDDEELTTFILYGLDFEFNPVVSAVVARVEPITINWGALFSAAKL